jgi:hypothetical protein
MIRAHRHLAIAMLAMLLPACSSMNLVPIRAPLSQPPLVEKLQIPVVVQYSEDLQNHTCLVDKGYILETWAIALGPPSIDMFNLIFSALFEKAMPINLDSDAMASIRPRHIIELRLSMFDGCEASWPILGTSVEIAYEATLHDVEGGIITRWEGRGKAGPGDTLENYMRANSTIGIETVYLSNVISLAMRNAAADFIINFDKDVKIRAWQER